MGGGGRYRSINANSSPVKLKRRNEYETDRWPHHPTPSAERYLETLNGISGGQGWRSPEIEAFAILGSDGNETTEVEIWSAG